MQIRSFRGSGEPARVIALSNARDGLGPDPRRALGPAAIRAASTGRTRDRTRPMLQKRQKVLARAPSTRDPQETCSALNCCCAKLCITGRSTRGNFLIDQIATQDHVGRPGPIASPALVGKMPDMNNVRRQSKPDRWLRRQMGAGMA